MRTTNRSLEQLRLAARAHSNDLETFVALGDALYDADEFDESCRAFERAIDIKPDSPEAAAGLARNLMIQGAYTEAKELLEAAMTHGLPQTAENLSTLAICYAFGGDFERARTLLEAALTVDSTYEPTYGALARLCLDTRDLEACEHYASEGLKRFRDNVPCLESRAQARFLTLNLEGAEADADAAIRLDPESVDALLCKASVLLARGDHDAAIHVLLQAQAAHPTDPDVYNVLGGAYLAHGDVDQAELSHAQALEVDPQSWQALHGLAAVALARHEWEEGLASVDAALEVGGADPALHFLRGTFLAMLDRREEAAEEFACAVEANPFDGLSYVSLAELEADDSQRLDAAREHALKALELFPDGPVAERAERVLARMR